MQEILCTPDERFTDLPGYPWTARYAENLPGFSGLRAHYLDEGPQDAPVTFLMLHGEPSWAYLYRRMIPPLLAAGHRVVAPDLFGFGRSDKPMEDATYTFSFHRDYLLRLVEHLRLRNVVLVCQDWGGLLGLTLPLDLGEAPVGLVVMNTTLGTGDAELPAGFLAWRNWVRNNPDLDAGRLIARGCPHLSPAEAAAYSAPFPDQRYKAGARRFPDLVPDRPDADGAPLSRAARDWWSREWNGPSLMAIGMRDPVLGPEVMHQLRRHIRNCPPPLEIPEAGHFVQEWGDQLIAPILQLWPAA